MVPNNTNNANIFEDIFFSGEDNTVELLNNSENRINNCVAKNKVDNPENEL